METRKGLLKKLGIFAGVAITFYIVGKKHIKSVKDERHRKETDARVDSDSNEFNARSLQPGLRQSSAASEFGQTDSKYVGSGLSYSSRKPGDKLSFLAILRAKRGESDEK